MWFAAPTVEYGRAGVFAGNCSTYVWATGSILVDGGPAGSLLQLLLVCCIEIGPSTCSRCSVCTFHVLCHCSCSWKSCSGLVAQAQVVTPTVSGAWQAVLNMGFEWDTNEMSVLIAAQLGGPLRGNTARIVINSIHVKGDVCE